MATIVHKLVEAGEWRALARYNNSKFLQLDSHSITICLKDKTFSLLEKVRIHVCGTREKKKIQSQRNYEEWSRRG